MKDYMISGSKKNGYGAMHRTRLSISCQIRRVEGGWKVTYYGSVDRNPWELQKGNWTCSCTSPLLELPEVFKTRREAAEAGIAARIAEEHYPKRVHPFDMVSA